jgi:acetyl-CoA synthetase
MSHHATALNLASILDHAARMTPERGAVTYAGRTLTYAELERAAERVAAALVEIGIASGDHVALTCPNLPWFPIAYYGILKAGAVVVPLNVLLKPREVAYHLRDSEAKALIAFEGSVELPLASIAKAACDEARCPNLLVMTTLPDAPSPLPGVPTLSEAMRAAAPAPCNTRRRRMDDTAVILYTSGTTGKPKGVLHVQGGFLVSIAREVAYQADGHPGDVILFATDMGWIMGPWTVVGGGAMGCSLVLMEGAPDWPDDRLWSLIDEEHVNILGCSPTLIRALIPKGEPAADLSSLRTIVTTGEPWNPGPYRWLFEHVGGGRCPIINCSGGTEVGACFLSPTPAIPIKEVSLGGPALGMAMDVVDAEGRSVRGEVGELVCRKPFPGMTRGFWRDPERYLETYWSRFPGVWTHGDWASVDEDGYWFLHGRSDDTLNIAGKRIGPAELESAAVAHPSVAEAAAVGVPHDVKGEVAWVFCVLAPGASAEEEDVRALVAQSLGKAFAPDRVLFVPALPKTRSAKIVRRAVRATALGQDPGDMSSVENPDALAAIATAMRG